MQISETARTLAMLAESGTMSWEEIISNEIAEFRSSDKYRIICDAEQYYKNRSDVQNKSKDVKNRTNSKIEHPIVRLLVSQKADYLLSKPFSVTADTNDYTEALEKLFDNEFRRKIHGFARDTVKTGISYLIPYFRNGKLLFMAVPAREIIPLWTDSENSELDGFIRFYDRVEYQGRQKTTVQYAEYWSRNGVQYFRGENGVYRYDPEHGEGFVPHFTVNGKPYNWAEVPLLWLRYNEEELPLSYFVKELVDSYNWQTSVTDDVLRDVAKFVYVLKNYGGTDLAQFVKELRECLAIEVNSDGGVDKLQPEIDISGVMSFIDKQRRDIFAYANGVDTKDPELGNASGTALLFRYMGLDNDCAALGAELQSTFQRLKIFADTYFQIISGKDFSQQNFSVVFNTDMPVNEGDVITNCRNSAGIISEKTILENHPWVKSAEEEQRRLAEEKQKQTDELGGNPFEELMNREQP